MNKPSRIVPFVLGLLLGVFGTIFLPGYVRPHLPEWLTGKVTVVKGTVAAKQKKDAVLLLTVNTSDGALLATFTKKVDEISLLVNEKDVIEFTLQKYAPLIENPRITRILKEKDVTAVPMPVGGAAEKAGTEAKNQQQGKAPAAAPAQGGAAGKKQPERK